jgi:hypothetical protein
MTGLFKFILNIVKEMPANQTNFGECLDQDAISISVQNLKGEGLIRSQSLVGNIVGKVSITHNVSHEFHRQCAVKRWHCGFGNHGQRNRLYG